MKQSDSYDRSIHRTGRLGSILAIAWMLGIPAVMCTVYHMFPSIPDLLLFGSGLLALYDPPPSQRSSPTSPCWAPPLTSPSSPGTSPT